MSYLNHYKCVKCGQEYALYESTWKCQECGHMLFAEYDLFRARKEMYHKNFGNGNGLWHYEHLLPPVASAHRLTLGEGVTPLIFLKKLSQEFEMDIFLKNEGSNATGSIRDREMSVQVAVLRETGEAAFIMKDTPNSVISANAYASLAEMKAVYLLPNTVPIQFLGELKTFGGEVILFPSEANKQEEIEQEIRKKYPWTFLTADGTPFRVEGAKTILFELWEQFQYRLPEVIILPLGLGITFLGIWKGMLELFQLGWIQRPFPKIIAVQNAFRAPVFNAWKGLEEEEVHDESIAVEMNVEEPVEKDLILQILQEEQWQVEIVDDDTILKTRKLFAEKNGMILSPEGAAVVNVLENTRDTLKKFNHPTVVLINPVNGLKYVQSIGFLKN